ncbi:MAG TPA: 8-oxoguanine deaminase [Spirochaetia bacterium]|nr:8-oxoguanine deaminase [Spirochaetales bacterium]HQK33739.1 8-oxoguanine deaminase [Spirochaetales bacterium]HRS64431.1 8-oxoguanine deaminase [Spirochaetia bacterium]HRV29311.1 8-oxoguanine deaminase [Spirochaetia bacterium]
MILLKNCFWVMKPHYGSGNSAGSLENDLHGVDILIKGNRIAEIAPTITAPAGTTIIDASKHLVMPGMVNTHHHFYQTLTRNVPAVQNAKLFTWLVYLYEIWKGIDEEAVYLSSKLALAELAKTGCTLSTDHHYLYPVDFKDDLPGLQFKAASEIGIRFAPTRGSMSRSKKDGGLPPDTVVQDEETILIQSEEAIQHYHDPAPDAMRKIALAPCSPFSVSENLMKESARLARRYGARLHTHLAETADEDEYCMRVYGRRPLKVMEDCEFIGPDVWYAHGIHFTNDELETLARYQTGVAHCPASNMRLASGICRVREMLDKGIPVGLAVDGSASNDSSDMLGEARQALLLQRVRYGATGSTAREIFGIATEGGSRLLGFPQAGTLEIDSLADIALFDLSRLEYAGALSDPPAALLFSGYNHGVDYLIVNGSIVVSQGKLVHVDEEALAEAANKAARKLLSKAGVHMPW